MYHVYILECADGSLYTGIALNVEERFAKHVKGEASAYTRSRGARRIVYTEQCESRGAALKREVAIKKLTRTQKLALCEQ